MDAATEPLLVVIDHPIAGNPAQFAIESALRAMQLDWRVLSFDVVPQNAASALEGFAVTGITGVLIGQSLQQEATRWYRRRYREPGPQRIDCLSRNPQQDFVGSDVQSEWISQRIRAHAGGAEAPVPGIWFGDSSAGLPVEPGLLADQPSPIPPPASAIAQANWIAVAASGSEPAGREHARLYEHQWPQDDGSTLVVDLSDSAIDSPHPALGTLVELGYQVVPPLDRLVGTLATAVRRWTGREPPPEIIRDAIEEYLEV